MYMYKYKRNIKTMHFDLRLEVWYDYFIRHGTNLSTTIKYNTFETVIVYNILIT